MEKKTPLYESHVALGGKIVEFGGYLMPVQYPSGVIAEHMAVRTKAGLFDVSHMAELAMEGPAAVANIQHLVTADISKMVDGQVKYAMLCNDQGGIVDDLVIYRRGPEQYLLVVNAGNHDKDAAWVSSHLSGDVKYRDVSDEVAQLALQGPASAAILRKICAESDIPEKYYHFCEGCVLHLEGGRDITAIISQTGYTGEFGYEIYCSSADVTDLWNTLLSVGKDDGLIPCGLGARDTLRLEAAMPLYGHEMNDGITPKEAGLPCKLDGKEFIGRDAIIAKGAPKIKRIGMKVTGRGIIREHLDIYTKDGKKIGWTSSGTYCPFMEMSVAMGYIDIDEIEIGKKLDVDVRGRKVEVEIVPLPFYKIDR
ncbi:MAG: glycine cleavage system aminomethyltransferase GcvT [Oscillibacter sp.]|jgi:aminomethyltransferase|nr:glycine cleavage system aminomethyltransferase GcvT [Oscillibacter sp.]